MDVKQLGDVVAQSITPISFLSPDVCVQSSLLPFKTTENVILVDSLDFINRGLSKTLEILPTKAPLSTLKQQPVKNVSEIFTPINKALIEVKSSEEGPADSILKNQGKLREYTPSVTRTVSIVEDDSAALLAKALLTYFEKSNFSIPFQERILPSTMKYAESVQRGYSVCTEVLVRKDHITAGPVSQEGLSLEKPKIASLSPDYLEIPTLCLEDILRDENNLLDTLDDTLDVKPFEKTESLVNIASASHTNTLMTSNDPLSSSRLHQFKISQILDSDDAIVDSLLTNLIEERILPTVSQISSESQYQWASTTPLSEAEYEALRPHLAMKYPFELDYFQRQAIMRLERRESVFVAAHTSAGKTVVAEYAIALAKKHHTRTIYTSPIKALSNQKYRDFRDRFDDVGLITGDVSINPDAACLIMTTEILRSMLYRGSDTIRDIEFVIFDEVHYVNDSERGVVWEEVIIMLPDKINMIFLSATTPNTLEFSDWIGRTKQRKVFVVSTSKRPVPLQHYLYYDDNMFCLMKNEGQFRSEEMSAAVQKEKDKLKPKVKSAENAAMASQRQAEKAAIAAQASGGRAPKVTGRGTNAGRGTQPQKTVIGDIAGGKGQWLSLLRILRQGGREAAGGHDPIDFGVGFAAGLKSKEVQHEISLMKRYDLLPDSIKAQMSRREYEQLEVRSNDDDDDDCEGGLLPVVVFCFSKKKCEEIVDFFKGQDLISAREKSEVKKVMNKVFSRLNPSDARLPQVIRIEEMLLRGFGVHHGGLLPVLKESVELLYSKSVVKVLLATETFAMGVNMPARSVVFNGFRKHDGKGFRDLYPGEYTQMAGRAGRRGKDKVGTVIVAAWTELPSEISMRKLLTGTPTVLSSQFRLTYNMMLNLLRANDLGVEDMMKKSFSEFRMQRALASNGVAARLNQYEKALQSLFCNEGSLPEDLLDVRSFYEAVVGSHKTFQSLLSMLIELKGINEVLTLFSPGRFVMLHHQGVHYPNLLHFGVLIGEDLSTAIFDPNTKQSSSSLLQNLRQDMAPKLGETKPRDLLASKFVWVRLISLGSGSLDHQVQLEKVPVTAVVGILTQKMKIQNNRSDFQELSKPKDSIPVMKRKDDHVVGKSKETSRKVTSPEEELRCIDRDLLSYLSSNIYLGSPIFLDLSMETKVKDFRFCELNSDFLTFASKITSCQTWSTFGQCFLPNHSDIQQCALFQSEVQREYKIHQLEDKIKALKYYTSNASLSLFPDFLQRMKVLAHLGYIENSAQGYSNSQTVTLKGRVACEMNTCDELIATEILFFNILEPLNPPEVAALLSALVFQEKNQESPPLTTRLEVAKVQVLNLSKSLQTLQDDFGVVTNENEQRGNLNFGLAAPVYQWARGIPFQDIAEMTLTPEGSIVRTITRLDELCKDFRNAARVVGNPSLYRKMEATSQCIKRDIVFAASLYVS